MTTPAVLPALLIAHDATGEAAIRRATWIVEGAGLSVVGCLASEFTADRAQPALHEVGAYDAFLVVHVVGPLDDPGLSVADRGDDPVGVLIGSLASVHEELSRRFPGKKRIDQWVIHTVGQVIDNSERDFIRQVSERETPGLRGVIVSASASHASVTHDDDEQAGFAADVLLALLGSDLERQLADAAPVAWIAGTTSLTYAATRIGEAISAHHALRVLDEHLLAQPPAGDPAFDMGEVWVEELDLPHGNEREILLASTSGGSLLARVRMDQIDWEEVPITSWVDVLTTQQHLIASQELETIQRVIEENRRKRLEELQRGFVGRSFEELESSIRFESTLTLGRGAQAGLEKVAQRIPEPTRGADPEQIERDRTKLRHFTRWLPFGPAVALRLFAAALGGLVVVSALTGASDLPLLSSVSKPWGRVSALTILLIGFVLYQRRVQTTLKVRDRLNLALEKELVDLVEQWVVDARREIIVDLRAWIGARLEWLDDGSPPVRPEGVETLSEWFGWLIHESRMSQDALRVRAQDRRDPAGLVSRYTVDIPSTASVSTAKLSDQLLEQRPEPSEGARALIVAIRPRCQPAELQTVLPELLHAFWTGWLGSRLRTSLWADLGALLKDSPTVRDSARRMIEANTTPGLDSTVNAPTVRTSHYLVVPGGARGTAYAQMFSPDIEASELPGSLVSGSLTDVMDFAIPDVALMVHLFALDPDSLDISSPPIPSNPAGDGP